MTAILAVLAIVACVLTIIFLGAEYPSMRNRYHRPIGGDDD